VTDPTPRAQPGWYPIAPGSSQLRWWDGSQWTDHTHDAATSYGQQQQQPAKAPEGTRPYTVWIWILAITPLASFVPFITMNYPAMMRQIVENPDSSAVIYASQGYLISVGIGFLVYALSVVLSLIDYLALKKAGVPRPFHWAWSFLNVGVYVIGRSVIARRRIGKGIAPMWVWIALYVVVIIVVFAIIFSALAAALPYSQYPVGG
jgi:hypothetical protein